ALRSDAWQTLRSHLRAGDPGPTSPRPRNRTLARRTVPKWWKPDFGPRSLRETNRRRPAASVAASRGWTRAHSLPPRVATDDEFARGAMLFDTGAYWEAHEAWEGPWRRERRAWQQGLIQVAAAFHKLFAKKDVEAARRILSRAVTKLDAEAD